MALLCFACGKPITDSGEPRYADTRDDQIAEVGPDCYKRIQAAGAAGYLPRRGGIRLFPLPVPVELVRIARDHLGVTTLATRNSDELDCYSLSVDNLRAALQAAFDAGRASR